MNASEMTNERIAEELVLTIPHLSDAALSCTDADDILREAAARLRDVTVRSDNSNVIAELSRRLKVAEDALNYVMSVAAIEEAWSNTSNALAAIREEGGAK